MKRKTSTVLRDLLFLLLTIVLITACTGQNKKLVISGDVNHPAVRFAIEEIKVALGEKGGADISFSIVDESETLEEEGFSLMKTGKGLTVLATDYAGAMYGGLELAEQIRIFGLEGVRETTQNPYMERRGTKFNIPLDVRTPSYTDLCDAGQANIPEMWSMAFWMEYIDNLARYRYNFISLWNLHPFPSMVRVPGYEDVALEDVQRSTTDWKEYYSGIGVGFCDPEIVANPEIVKKISMDEKIEFWKEVMAYGKSRNVDFYIVTWNIFTYGTSGKYGITDKAENPVTTDYFRKSVKQMFMTYPDLAGIGLTTGENMPGYNLKEKEEWAYNTYAMGVLDAAEAMPDRKFTFIHRQHMTGALDIAAKFRPIIDHPNIEFLFSFKYAKAHVMSATTQPYHQNFVKEITGMKTIWTLRNDDVYHYRWGAPDFVREFIQNIPLDVSRGFYYGSDQWIWGREFLALQPDGKRQIEIVKHWYHWMIWGRLGYNPEVSNERFTGIIQDHFPEADASKLFAAWQEASMIYSTTTGFHWGSLDFQWYIEGCKSRPGPAENETGFHDVNRFITLPPHACSGDQSIPAYVEMVKVGGVSNLTNPFEVAQKLHAYSDGATKIIESFRPAEQGELNATVMDISTMALLGKYYAYKIEGATNLALYRETKDAAYQVESIARLTMALEAWKSYTVSALEQYKNPLWTNRVGYVDWVKITEWVEHDIEIARAD